MNTKFTTGPWVCDSASFTEDADVVNYAIRAKGMVIGMANAHLIAAAPMLYEAMDRILNAEDATQYGVDNDNRDARYRELAMALQDGRAALKAARGES